LCRLLLFNFRKEVLVMPTKELIEHELDRMTEEQLAALYAYIQQTLPPPVQRHKNLLDAMQDPKLQSDAPADFPVAGERYVGEWAAKERDAPATRT